MSFVLCACGYTSIQPLSSPQEATFDNRLSGVWSAKSDEGEVFLHVGKSRKNEKMTHAIYVEHENQLIKDMAEFEMFQTSINGHFFMNIKLPGQENEENEFYFIKYVLEGQNVIRVYLLNPDLIMQAIKEAKLRGTIPKEKTIKSEGGKTVNHYPLMASPTITDDSENIMQFIKKI